MIAYRWGEQGKYKRKMECLRALEKNATDVLKKKSRGH